MNALIGLLWIIFALAPAKHMRGELFEAERGIIFRLETITIALTNKECDRSIALHDVVELCHRHGCWGQSGRKDSLARIDNVMPSITAGTLKRSVSYTHEDFTLLHQ